MSITYSGSGIRKAVYPLKGIHAQRVAKTRVDLSNYLVSSLSFDDYESNTLGAAVSDTSTTSIAVSSAVSLSVPFYLRVDSETMLCTAKDGTTLTVTRGAGTTTAATHSSGTTVYAYKLTDARGKIWTPNANVYVADGYAVFGDTDGFFTTPAAADWSFGTDAFTWEFYLWPAEVGVGHRTALEARSDSSSLAGFSFLRYYSEAAMNFYMSGSFQNQSAANLIAKAWNHVVASRSSAGTITYWINGVSSGSFFNQQNLTDGASYAPKLGGSTTSGEAWRGYMDRIRIYKGIEVYTAAFTPPARTSL